MVEVVRSRSRIAGCELRRRQDSTTARSTRAVIGGLRRDNMTGKVQKQQGSKCMKDKERGECVEKIGYILDRVRVELAVGSRFAV